MTRFGSSAGGLALTILCALLLSCPTRAAHLVTQTLELQPGWNAVYLEVEPPTNTPLSVFAAVPISSVWTWIPKNQPTEFFQNMSEALHTDPRWLVFFPTNRYEKMFNDLYRVYANWPYLIKLAGSNNFTWTVSGRPAVPRFAWKPNEFNLAGFPLNPGGPAPSVGQFLAPSTALNGQALYRLNSTGAWDLVVDAAGESMRPGESMWIYAAETADYMGPVKVAVPAGDGLDYAGLVSDLNLQISNCATSPATIHLRDLSGTGGPIAYWTLSGTEVHWLAIPDPLTITLQPGEQTTLRLAVRREQFTSDIFETTLEITSDLGTRVRVPVSATRADSF